MFAIVRPVSRGIVLWPDITTSRVIRDLWDELETEGVPSMATHTHKLHKPHVSLIVAEHLPVNASLQAVGPVPTEPIRLLIEAAGVFPGGFLFLACVANVEMLDEQRRVHRAVQPLAVDPAAGRQLGGDRHAVLDVDHAPLTGERLAVNPFNPKLVSSRMKVVTIATNPKSDGVNSRASTTVETIWTPKPRPPESSVKPAPRTASCRVSPWSTPGRKLPLASKGLKLAPNQSLLRNLTSARV